MQCYARELGSCSMKMSKEHYISKSILTLAGSAVEIQGFPWQANGERSKFGINSLSAKILCQHHNSDLSSLDQAGSLFLTTLRNAYSSIMGGVQIPDECVKVEGKLLELWLLKILCGVIAMSQSYVIPNAWLEFLFQIKPIPSGLGLYFFGEQGMTRWIFNLVRIYSVSTRTGAIGGAKYGIAGLPFLLAFGNPDFEDSSVEKVYHPSQIMIKNGGNSSEININWGDEKPNERIILTLPEGTYLDDEMIKPLVGKFVPNSQ